MPAKRCCRGFSLLEVLVALVVASLICALAFRAIGGASRHTVHSQQFQHGLQLADSQMTELIQQPHHWLGRRQGRLPGGYRWASQVQPEQASNIDHEATSDWLLYRVDLQLLLPGANSPAIRLSTLRMGRQP